LDELISAFSSPKINSKPRNPGKRTMNRFTLPKNIALRDNLPDNPSSLKPLTARERQVTELLRAGQTHTQISKILGIQKYTVLKHVLAIKKKLHIKGPAVERLRRMEGMGISGDQDSFLPKDLSTKSGSMTCSSQQRSKRSGTNPPDSKPPRKAKNQRGFPKSANSNPG
jgi:DNA-binding CsgD family transcriptional regulator